MKKIIIILILVVIVGGWLYYANQKEEAAVQEEQTAILEDYEVLPVDMIYAPALIEGIESSELSEIEKEALLTMREEEKLAHDVYFAFNVKWRQPIFDNIARSEKTHMDAILTLMERYSITDNARPEYGGFGSNEFQALYNRLVTEGAQSIEEGYRVGALIEELNIKDLENYLAQTDNEDIRLILENLQRGSRNHLRAYNRQLLKATGQEYVPVHLSNDEFRKIVDGTVEQGPKGGQGRGN